jgi:hypothetical protein
MLLQWRERQLLLTEVLNVQMHYFHYFHQCYQTESLSLVKFSYNITIILPVSAFKRVIVVDGGGDTIGARVRVKNKAEVDEQKKQTTSQGEGGSHTAVTSKKDKDIFITLPCFGCTHDGTNVPFIGLYPTFYFWSQLIIKTLIGERFPRVISEFLSRSLFPGCPPAIYKSTPILHFFISFGTQTPSLRSLSRLVRLRIPIRRITRQCKHFQLLVHVSTITTSKTFISLATTTGKQKKHFGVD